MFNRNTTLTSLALLTAATLLTATDRTNADATPSHTKLLDATFEAHGGLDVFRAQRHMTYTMHDFPLSPQMAKPNTTNVDLWQRLHRIDGEGFTVGFDGTNAWSTPALDSSGLPPRFVTLGSFYFIGMPFVFGDAGTILTDGGAQSFNGKTYRTVNVGYLQGVGKTSKDDYVLFIDPDTDELALIHHSVTENPDVDRVTWTFDAWQEINGLLVPAKLTLYVGWNPDNPGEGASFTVTDFRLSTTAPNERQFIAPADAVRDDRPALH